MSEYRPTNSRNICNDIWNRHPSVYSMIQTRHHGDRTHRLALPLALPYRNHRLAPSKSKSSSSTSAKVCQIIYSIQPRSHVRSFGDVVVAVTVAVDICGSGGGTDSGVGAVELPATGMPRQKVVDQLVDTGWIEKSTYFPHRNSL